MPRSICLFGELDTYTGSFPQSLNALPLLVNQLKVACLLYDEVIVNTNVLFDHSLTLPAFEELSMFSKSGVLWTTAVENEGLPENYVVKRAKKLYGENLKSGISKKGEENLKLVIERWQRISPSYWKLVRKVSHQQRNATTNIIKNFDGLHLDSKQSIELRKSAIDLCLYMQDKGMFDRNEMITRLGAMRELVTKEEFAKFALIIQGEYMNQGAHNKGDVTISLFPGKYIRHLQKNSFLFKAQPLPVELNDLERIGYRLSKSGFPLQYITRLSTKELFYFSQSCNWKKWRRYVRSDLFSIESIKELTSLKKAHQSLAKALNILLKNIDTENIEKTPKQTLLLLPTPWVASGLAYMGSIVNEEVISVGNYNKKDYVLLDLQSRKIIYQNKKIILEKSSIILLTLFSATGNNGVPIETIKQLDIEVDLTKRTLYNNWRAQKGDNEDLDIARLNRLNVAKNRLNKAIEPLGIFVHVKRGEGIWSLATLRNKHWVKILLRGTPWAININGKIKLTQIIPVNLTKRERLLLNFFIKNHSSFISAKAIAIELNIYEFNPKKISDIIYKFKKKLVMTNFYIVKSYQGEYMLLPKLKSEGR